MKRLSILGATGSIGRQALEVVAAYPERFSVAALAARGNVELLAAQAMTFHPEVVAVADPSAYRGLRAALAGEPVRILAGAEGVAEAAALGGADLTLVAMVGATGIAPTLAAIDAGKEIALANKETLVAAGALVTARARANRTRLIPVDSEHSAIFQCMTGVERAALRRIILTASGGPFLARPLSDLDRVTVAEALRHPNWRMGDKITIDSATLFNKGLEVIEAHWLFGLDFAQIEVVIHPGSIVHSLVELVDGAILAQLGAPDMRLPIAYALSYPERLPASWPGLSTLAGLTLSFEAAAPDRYPALALAYEMGKRGGTWPAVLNAANEVAVAAFLAGRIRFTEIVRIVERVCGYYGGEDGPEPSLPVILAADAWARARARELVSPRKE